MKASLNLLLEKTDLHLGKLDYIMFTYIAAFRQLGN